MRGSPAAVFRTQGCFPVRARAVRANRILPVETVPSVSTSRASPSLCRASRETAKEIVELTELVGSVVSRLEVVQDPDDGFHSRVHAHSPAHGTPVQPRPHPETEAGSGSDDRPVVSPRAIEKTVQVTTRRGRLSRTKVSEDTSSRTQQTSFMCPARPRYLARLVVDGSTRASTACWAASASTQRLFDLFCNVLRLLTTSVEPLAFAQQQRCVFPYFILTANQNRDDRLA